LLAEGIEFVEGRANLAQRITNEELASLLDESEEPSLDEPAVVDGNL